MNWDKFLYEFFSPNFKFETNDFVGLYVLVGLPSLISSSISFFKNKKTKVEQPSVTDTGDLMFLTIILCLFGWPLFFLEEYKSNKTRLFKSYLSCIILCGSFFTYFEPTMSLEEKRARAEKIYQVNKIAIEQDHEYKLREAKAQVKLAEIEAKQRALYNEGKYDNQLAKAQAELSSLQAKGADYSKLSQATISSSKSKPVDEQTKLILSALWLGACFFLQRLFERSFHNKGYALLTVCATGFLLAFFTANYFLLGGSVIGGIMGSVGDRV